MYATVSLTLTTIVCHILCYRLHLLSFVVSRTSPYMVKLNSNVERQLKTDVYCRLNGVSVCSTNNDCEKKKKTVKFRTGVLGN